MGAVTAIMYGDKDPSIAALVLDSPFSSLKTLVEEIVKKQVNVADFVIQMALGIVGDSVKERAKFEIKNIEPIFFAKRCFIPALFCVAKDDDFVLPHHAKKLFEIYPGDKSFLEVDGDHNSTRPKILKDTAAIFLYNALVENFKDFPLDSNRLNAPLRKEEVKYDNRSISNSTSNSKNIKQDEKKQEVSSSKNKQNVNQNQKPVEKRIEKPIVVEKPVENKDLIDFNFNNLNDNMQNLNVGQRMQEIRNSTNLSNNVNNNQNVNQNVNTNVYQNNKNIISNIYGIENETDEEEVLKRILDYSKKEYDDLIKFN